MRKQNIYKNNKKTKYKIRTVQIYKTLLLTTHKYNIIHIIKQD